MRTVLVLWAAVAIPTAFSQTTHVGGSVARRNFVAPPTPAPCLPNSLTACNVRNVVMGRMETVLKSPPVALSVPISSVNSILEATPTASGGTLVSTVAVPPLFTPSTEILPTSSVPNEPSRVVSPRRLTTTPIVDESDPTTSEDSEFSLPPLSLVAGLGGLAGLAAIVSIGVTAIYLVRRRRETPPPFDLNHGFHGRSGTGRNTTAERPTRQGRNDPEKHKDLRMNTAKAIFFPTFARKMLGSRQRLASLPVASQPEEPIPEPYLKPQLQNEDSWVTYMDHLYRRSQARFSLMAFGGTSSGSGAVGRRRNGSDDALTDDHLGNGSDGSRPLDVLVPPFTIPREPHMRSPIRGTFEELGSTSINGEREEIVDDGASESTATTILYKPNNDPWASYNYGTTDAGSDRDQIEDGVPRYGGDMWDSSNVGTIRNGQSSRLPGSEAPPTQQSRQGNFPPPTNQQNNINVPLKNDREKMAKNGNPFANLRTHHAPIERESNRPSVFSLITASSFDTESFVSMSDYNRDNAQSFIPGTSRMDH